MLSQLRNRTQISVTNEFKRLKKTFINLLKFYVKICSFNCVILSGDGKMVVRKDMGDSLTVLCYQENMIR